jgi:hypothetical protein
VGRKRYDFFRTRFVVQPKNSILYGSASKVKAHLLALNSIYGIGVSVKEVPGGNLEIVTRTGLPETAKMDRNFVRYVLQHHAYIVEEVFEGRRFRGRREIWEPAE